MDDHTFVRKVAAATGCEERRAETLIFVVFQELRDRLTAKEAGDVAAQLPASLRGLWTSFDRQGRQVRRIDEPTFIYEVGRTAMLDTQAEAENAVKAVFGTLQEALGSNTGKEGEAWHIFSQLPSDLKRLWLDAGRRGGG
jgi:uncharacterized protein (DUF2267 family)